jgi:hypothetical protein
MIRRALAAIWRILTLTCDDSTRLMSTSLDERLPWWDGAAVRLHAAICRACRRFLRQIRFLREAARRSSSEPTVSDGPGPAPSARLTGEARRRMEDAIRRATNQTDG